MRAARYALQWLGLLLSLPFAAWGAVQLLWHPDRASLTRDNCGLDRLEMRDAWARVLARPWSKHEWKNVTATFTDQVHAQMPAKIFGAIAVAVFVIGLMV